MLSTPSNCFSIGKVAWTWVGRSTPRSLLHQSAHTATSRLMFFIYPSIKVGRKWRVESKAIIHHVRYTFSAQVCLPAQVCFYSALLFQVHFVWPLMRFCGVRAFVCGSKRGDASLPRRPSLPQIGVECESEKKREKKHLSPFHSINHDSSFSSTSLVPPPRSHFYSHTSQPMSSHLHSPACKLYRSVSTNDAYQQWCVFSLRWHSKYKWGIIYNSPMDLSRKQEQLW